MRFVQDLCKNYMTYRSYFGKYNSTPGSVVPLATFLSIFLWHTYLKGFECVCAKGQEIHSGRDKDILVSISITASHAQSAI